MEAATQNRTVSLTIPAKPDYVVLARLALSAVCRLAPFSPDEVADLKLAITESATYLMGGERRSVARGAGDDAASRSISFTFDLGDDVLCVYVRGMELPTVSAEERELSLALINATVDEHRYAAGEMTLTKRLRTSPE
jgi:hypothetical protein